MKHLLVFVLLLTAAASTAQHLEWARKGTSINQSQPLNICTDYDGSSYVVGYFSDSITFSPFKLGAQYFNLFIVKYSPEGDVLWAKKTTGGGVVVVANFYCVADHRGNIYVASGFTNSITIGTKTLNAENGKVFISKFDTSGNFMWAINGDAISVGIAGLACDSTGNVYVIGNSLGGTITYGTQSLANPGDKISYVVKIRADSTSQWVKKIARSDYSGYTFGIAIDKAGYIYTTGEFHTSVVIGTTTLTKTTPPTGAYDNFVAKFDSNGIPLWAVKSGMVLCRGSDIAVGKTGDIYVGGRFDSNGYFDTVPISIPNHRMQDFIAKYNPSGRVLWVRYWNSTIAGSNLYPSSICLDSFDNIYRTGSFGDSCFIGNDTLISAKENASSKHEVFVAALTKMGDVRWTFQGKGLKENWGMGISATPAGFVYVSGRFINAITFDDITLTGGSTTKANPFILKFLTTAITTSGTVGSVFCAGALVTVNFSKRGQFESSNKFYLQISDSAGNFAKGRLIDSLVGTTDSVFHSRLPFDLLSGNKYRLRVIGILPLTYGSDNDANITIFAAPMIVFDPPSPVKVCGLKSPLPLKATAAGGTSYIWRDGPTGSSRTVTKDGWYYVTVENENVCERTDSILVIIDEAAILAKITPTKTTIICEGTTAGLLASGGQYFRWSTGDTTKLLLASKQGWYKVTVTDTNGCSGIDSIYITVLPAPKISMDPTGTKHICPGDTITLTASAAPNYLWSTGDTTRSITIDSAGTYYVSTKDSNCTGLSETLIVYEYAVPDKPVITRDGATLQTTAPPPLQWYLNGQQIPGETGESITVTEEGDYTVIVTNSNGCTALSATYHFSFSSVKVEKEVPLLTVFPNPTTSAITVTVSSVKPQHVKVELLSVLGERVVELFNGELPKEKKEISYVFPARVGEGVYFVRMEADSGVKTIKLMKK